MKVYYLEHIKDEDDCESVKSLGIYATMHDAKQAIERFLMRPGFCDYPDGFNIDAYEVGEDCWAEGFTRWDDFPMKDEG